MAAAPLSPSSSPRLPSPPPIAEDQLGPKSPALAATDEQQKQQLSLDHAAARRIRPGTKAADMTEGPPLVELTDVDSAFQLTEHLKALHYSLTHPEGSDSVVAVDRDMAHKLAEAPEGVERTLWLYELCRFLTMKANAIITALFSDDPPCSSITCPEMRASEWQYLCAVHDPPKACCAIDYCCHTLDWAANTLTSTKTFPSRLALDTNQTSQHQQIRHLTNIFRRVYRIFAHAWFQHRDMFWKVEGRTGLYTFFKTVCDVYGLIPADNYTIPPEAEGLEASQAAPPTILRREASGSGPQEKEPRSAIEGMGEHTLSTAGTTKRHRHSPSVGVTSVQTVMEENEEDTDSNSNTRGSVIHLEAPKEEKEEAPAQEEIERPGSAQSSENSFVEVEAPSSPGAEENDAKTKDEPEKVDDVEEPASSEKVETNDTQEPKAEEKTDDQSDAKEEVVTGESTEQEDSNAKRVESNEEKDDEKEKEEKEEEEKVDAGSEAPAEKDAAEKAS